MKIVVTSEYAEKDNKMLFPPFYTKADSTLLKGGKPFFVPDFTTQCVMTVHLVARICRLGKGFSTRFSYRYVDAWTLGANFIAQDLLNEGRHAAAVDFDGSTMIGDFIEVKDLNFDSALCEMQLGEETVRIESLADAGQRMLEDISKMSYFFTWKQGDLLFSCPLYRKESVHKDEHISCMLGKQKLLEFNIK